MLYNVIKLKSRYYKSLVRYIVWILSILERAKEIGKSVFMSLYILLTLAMCEPSYPYAHISIYRFDLDQEITSLHSVAVACEKERSRPQAPFLDDGIRRRCSNMVSTDAMVVRGATFGYQKCGSDLG